MVELERPLSGTWRALWFPTGNETRAAGEKAEFFTLPGNDR
jgi:hypothetical protein